MTLCVCLIASEYNVSIYIYIIITIIILYGGPHLIAYWLKEYSAWLMECNFQLQNNSMYMHCSTLTA